MSTKLSTDLSWSRSSTKLHAPPGGHSSINIFGGDPAPARERKFSPPNCPPLPLQKLRVPEYAAGIKKGTRPNELHRAPLANASTRPGSNLHGRHSENQTSQYQSQPPPPHQPQYQQSQYQQQPPPQHLPQYQRPQYQDSQQQQLRQPLPQDRQHYQPPQQPPRQQPPSLLPQQYQPSPQSHQIHASQEQYFSQQHQQHQQYQPLQFDNQPQYTQPCHAFGGSGSAGGSSSCWDGAVVPNWSSNHGRGTKPIVERPWEDASRQRLDVRNRAAMDVAEMDRADRLARQNRSSVRVGAPPGGRSQISFC